MDPFDLMQLTEEEATTAQYPQIIQSYLAGARSASAYVSPIYDREPNITIPRPRV